MKMIKVEELHKEANGNNYTSNTYGRSLRGLRL